MRVVIGPELPAYSSPPDKFHRARREARAYLDGLMTDEEAAACVQADIEYVRALRERERSECPCGLLPSTFAATCRAADGKQRLHTAELLMQQKDPARMRAWLSRHNADEREAILRHLERRKKGRNEGNG
jgi:hypothetical protein